MTNLLHTAENSATVLGYRKDGRPIYRIAGAAPEPGETPPPAGDSITVPVPNEPAQPPQTPAERTFTEADIAKARQEEKDKLYKELNKFREQTQTFQSELETLRKEREAEQARIAAEQKAAEEAARKQREEEMSAKELLAQKEQEWTNRFTQLEQERQQERALLEKEKQFTELQAYAQQRVQAAIAENQVAPELADFVGGNTREEIDASLEFVKAKSEAIVQSVAQAQVQARAQMRGVSPTGYSTTGPMDTDPGHKTYTNEDLKNMSMQEYAKIRPSLLGAASQGQNRGLYG